MSRPKWRSRVDAPGQAWPAFRVLVLIAGCRRREFLPNVDRNPIKVRWDVTCASLQGDWPL
jgi:hypothetical protein